MHRQGRVFVRDSSLCSHPQQVEFGLLLRVTEPRGGCGRGGHGNEPLAPLQIERTLFLMEGEFAAVRTAYLYAT